MTSANQSARKSIFRIERALLAALCRESVTSDVRATIVQRLKTHRFTGADHEVVFRAVLAMPTLEHGRIPAALTLAVTRMGFPDIELRDYFNEALLSTDELLRLVAQL